MVRPVRVRLVFRHSRTGFVNVLMASGKIEKSASPLCRKLAVKILVAANPNLNPQVTFKSLCDGTVITRHPHRPKARVGTQSFQLQRRMGGIFEKLLIRGAGGILDDGGKRVIILPEVFRAQRFHFDWSKSASRSSEKAAGLLFSWVAISSPKAVSAGRGRASEMMRCHFASPFNSGRMEGKSSARRSRSAGGSALIAASISAIVLILSACYPGLAGGKLFFWNKFRAVATRSVHPPVRSHAGRGPRSWRHAWR